MAINYEQLGVSSQKEDVHKAIANLDKGLFPNAFCKILPDFLAQSPQHVNILHADGAGTKSSLAYLYWKETGDISVFKGLAQDAIVMNTDDVACAGATNHFIINSVIGRNKRLIPGEIIKEIIDGFESCIAMFQSQGIELAFAGGETADVGDLVQTLIVDANLTARYLKKDVIDFKNIKKGDSLIGLASGGSPTIYEEDYNAGIGSNGLTLARHALLHESYKTSYPESYDAGSPNTGFYAGNYKVTDALPGSPVNIGKALLSPTRTYLPVIYRLKKEGLNPKAIVHCTGGGQSKIKKFLTHHEITKQDLFESNSLFSLIKKEAIVETQEMLRTFNCGHRMELIFEEKQIEEALQIIHSFNLEARRVGTVTQDNLPSSRVLVNYFGETFNL